MPVSSSGSFPAYLISLLLVLGSGGCEERAPSPSRPTTRELPASNVAMAAELEALAETRDREPLRQRETRPFRANRPAWIPLLLGELEGLADPRREIELRHTLARELVQDGRGQEAWPHYERVYELALAWNLPPADKGRLLEMIQREMVVVALRQAEQENCLAGHHERSCIFPIEGRGVHARPEGALRARELLLTRLERQPGHPGARWLLNLTAMVLGEYPDGVPEKFRIPPETFASEASLPAFPDRAEKLGVASLGLAGGCAVDDFTGDGRLDIVVSSWGMRHPIRFLVQGREGRFTDLAREAGLAGELGGLNLSHADYDGDGHLDLLVLRGGWLEEEGRFPDSLLRNRGDGTFENVSRRAGLTVKFPTHSAAWADFDLDGHLDLFIGAESRTGQGYRSILYHNRGDGTFEDWTPSALEPDAGFVKGVAWGDIDDDGDPDLYLSRAGQPNRLLVNQGRSVEEGGRRRWSFEEATERAGVREPRFSFPTWFFDFDNDGRLDLFVAGFDGAPLEDVVLDTLGHPRSRGKPRLYRNRGDGTFEDVTARTRLDRGLLTMGANFGDLDGDGFQDLYLGTGAPDLRTLIPNRMFRNDGGRVFQDVTTAGGFGHLQKGHGIAFADVDGDGDQDVFAVMGGWYTGDVFADALFTNPGTTNRWLTLRLEGRRANRFAVGARIHVVIREGGEARSIHALVGTGGSFGSGSHQVELGLGRAERIERLEIRWPVTGERLQVFEDVPLDRIVKATEGSSELEFIEPPGPARGSW